MSQILVKPEHIQGDSFRLETADVHHLLNVLRKKEGEEISFFDGRGGRYRGVLTRVDKKLGIAEGRIVERLRGSYKPFRVRLFQGLPKGSKFDFVIEKATELGADEIFPFLSKKSVVQPDEDSPKKDRWSRLAEAAAKQCDRPDVPTVHAPKKLSTLGKELAEGTTLYFSLAHGAESIRTALSNGAKNGVLNLVIGPESGFAPEEEKWMSENGGTPVTLGQLILRTETAGLAALTIVNYEAGLV